MKTILIFTQEYVLPNQTTCGGTGNFYKRYADALLEKGLNVVVFGSNKFAVDEQRENLRIHFVKRNYFKTHPIQDLLRSLGRKLHIKSLEIYFLKKEIAYLTKKLAQFIKEENIAVDIIETHDWGGYSLYLDKLNIPYVVRTHGSDTILKKYFGFKVSVNREIIEQEALKKVRNFIFVSETSKKMYNETFHKEGFLIHNGIMLPNCIPTSVIKHSIFFFGAAIVQKGIDIALKVFNNIEKIFTDATLHIVGGGYEEYLKQHGIKSKKNIINYGYLKDKELLTTINKADIFIFPSRGETFGLALCEAMALEKPIIASNIVSFNSIITNGENGFIANNIDEYCQYITKIFKDNTLREKISIQAKLRVLRDFNFENTVERSLLYYKKIRDDHYVL